jgi:hypothetical protein
MASENPLLVFLAEKKLTQKRFALRYRFPEPTVSTWVSGDRRPSLSSALRLETKTRGKIPVSSWPHLRGVVASLRASQSE